MLFRFESGWSLGNEVALAALSLALAVGAFSLAGAVRVDAPATAAAPAAEVPLPDVPPRTESLSEEALFAAVERDPFASEGLFDEEQGSGWSAAEPAPAAEAPAAVRLTGILLLPGGGAAALSIHGAPAQLVRVGATVDGWRLVSVAAGVATVEGPDGTLRLRLHAPAAPTAAVLAEAGTP